MNRFEHYFQLIMNNPDKYIRVNLIKPGHKKHRKERRELFDRITHTLKLMGIDYQIAENTTYKIRVVSREKKVNWSEHLLQGSVTHKAITDGYF